MMGDGCAAIAKKALPNPKALVSSVPPRKMGEKGKECCYFK